MDSVKKYFEETNVALVDKFVPFYCSSVACHLANLENKEREFYIRQGSVSDLRLHIFFVAPPGFSKSLILKKFLKGTYSAMGKSNIEVGFEGLMTEASYTGTVEDGKKIRGAAWDHRKSILGVDEFSVLTDTMKMEYGKSLDKALLTSLDDGLLTKRLRGGKVSYETNLSLWCGSQPLRFDLSSGLGRRFFFIYFIPTKKEEEKIKNMNRKDNQSLPNPATLNQIAEDVELLQANISKIESITISDEIYDLLDKLKTPHYEEVIYNRMSIGYTLATTHSVNTHLTIQLTDELEDMIRKEASWREEIKKGPEISQVVNILEDRGIMKLTNLKNKLTNFGLSYKQATRALSELNSSGVIRITKDSSSGKRASNRMVTLSNVA